MFRGNIFIFIIRGRVFHLLRPTRIAKYLPIRCNKVFAVCLFFKSSSCFVSVTIKTMLIVNKGKKSLQITMIIFLYDLSKLA